MPKFLPSCYQEGRGQGHTLCSRNPLFPTNHVAREKDQVKLSHVDRFWPMQEMTVSVWGVLWVPGSFLACSLIGLPEGRALMTPSPLIEIVFHEIWIDYSKPPKDRHAIDHSFWHSFVFLMSFYISIYLGGVACSFIVQGSELQISPCPGCRGCRHHAAVSAWDWFRGTGRGEGTDKFTVHGDLFADLINKTKNVG